MKQIIGTIFLVALLSLTIFAFTKTEESGSKTPVSSVSSARITE